MPIWDQALFWWLGVQPWMRYTISPTLESLSSKGQRQASNYGSNGLQWCHGKWYLFLVLLWAFRLVATQLLQPCGQWLQCSMALGHRILPQYMIQYLTVLASPISCNCHILPFLKPLKPLWHPNHMTTSWNPADIFPGTTTPVEAPWMVQAPEGLILLVFYMNQGL